MIRSLSHSVYRRRLEGKTDYRKRKAVLMSRIPFVTVGVSNKNIIVQFLRAKISGDVVVSSTHSRELIQKYGWKGSGNNLPAAYLVGFLSGLKAIKGDLKKAIPYLGTQRFIKRSRLAAVLKGVEDSGLSINFPEEAGPELDRIQGVHIANYAKELKRKDTDYKRRFSALLKQGLKPEDYPKHFKDVKSGIPKILKGGASVKTLKKPPALKKSKKKPAAKTLKKRPAVRKSKGVTKRE